MKIVEMSIMALMVLEDFALSIVDVHLMVKKLQIDLQLIILNEHLMELGSVKDAIWFLKLEHSCLNIITKFILLKKEVLGIKV